MSRRGPVRGLHPETQPTGNSAVAARPERMGPAANQYRTDGLVKQITRDLPQLTGRAETIIIAITNADIFIPNVNWRFAFAARSYNRIAIVSAARMGLPSVQVPAPDKSVLFARLLKMTLKQIGVLYYNMALNSDPKSLLLQ